MCRISDAGVTGVTQPADCVGMSRVLALINHDLTALWLRETVESVKPGTEFVRVESTADLLSAFDEAVDAVFVDTASVVPHGDRIVRSLVAQQPEAAVFIVMDDNDIESAASCVAAGARCLIARTAGNAAVRAAVSLAWPAAQAGEQRPATGRGGFTAREVAILSAMAEGLSNVDIGVRLYVSADTVKTQAKRLFSKLGVHDRAAAVAAGWRRGLIA